MSEKVIILYDSQYKRALEAALDKKIEDVKWYSVDSMTTQLYEIAVTIYAGRLRNKQCAGFCACGDI